MSYDDFGLNLDLSAFEKLLAKDDLVEEPIPIEKFATDKKYLGLSNGLSEIQLELARHIVQIFKPETLIQLHGEEKGLDIYERYSCNEVVAMVGKGGGKDYTSRICFAYISYLFHCLRDPLEYYGKDFGTDLILLNLAVNSQQAHQVFFDPFKNLLLRSPYFNEVGFEPRVREVKFFSRPVKCLSGHSESEGWEGYDLHTVVLDEIAAFKTDVELSADPVRARGSASQIYNMSKFSVMSRFPDIGKVVLLSFPRFKGDFITSRYEGATVHQEPKVWALKAATFEMNPTITRESLESEYQRNPIEAKSRFECDPPEMEDAFFREPEKVRAAFYFGDDPMNEDGTWKPWFNGTDGLPRFIHVDLGLKRDNCGLAMIHCAGMKDIEVFGSTETLPILNVDLVHSWEAKPGAEINFAAVRQMILDLSRKFSVAMVTFDFWNSADMMQALRNAGIPTEAFVVKKPAYETLSTAIYDGRLRGYWNEALVEDELLKLKLINNIKVDHPTGGSKDMADSLAGAAWTCFKYWNTMGEAEIEIWKDDLDAEIEEDMFMAKEEAKGRPNIVPVRTMPSDIEEWMLENI